MSEEHKSWRLFGKGEGAFQLGTGEGKTYVTRLEERLWGRSCVHWGPPEDTVKGFRSDMGLGVVEQRTIRYTLQASPLHAVFLRPSPPYTPKGQVSGVSSGASNPGSASIGCTADVRSMCSTVSNCLGRMAWK